MNFTASQDFLYRFTQFFIIEDTWLVDVVRLVICVFAWLTAALVAKLYFSGKTGRMNRYVAWGSVLTYWSVGYAQIISLASPTATTGITLLNLVVLLAMGLSLLGTLQVMHIGIFRKKKNHDK